MSGEATLLDDLDSEAGEQLVALARGAVAESARGGASDRSPAGYDAIPDARAGAFVTIERGERLRGCCGRVRPERPLPEAVRASATAAAEADPRCPPVESDELDEVTVGVTVLSPPRPVTVDAPAEYPDAIRVGRDGLIVTRGPYTGVLLPQVAVDRGWSARAFLTAACQKAGVGGDAWRRGGVDVKRFTGRSFEERAPRGEIAVRRYDRSEGGAVADGGRPAGGVRPPAVAGQFYAGRADDLRAQIEGCFRHEYGPGPIEDIGSREVTALVVPHAGYPYSGPVAAHGYGALASGPAPGTVVVLGPNHEGVGRDVAVSPHDHWRTPLGEVPVDGELASRVVERSPTATFDERAHAGEHSLEVQLPFLQYCLGEVRVVPVCLTQPGRDRAERFGADLAAAIDASDRDVTVVASTDLTHYESHGTAVAADEPVTEAIQRLDADAVSEAAQGGHTMCGPWATVAALTAAGRLGAAEGDLLQYATSGEIAGRKDRVVGYCSAVV